MDRAAANEIQKIDSAKCMFIDGRAFLTSHFFFDDGDERIVAEARNGLWFFDADVAVRRDAQLAAKRRLSSELGIEKAFEHKLAAELKAAGRDVRRQVETPFGCLDILLADAPVSLIELKRYGDIRSIGYAIGQLFSYQREYPRARLFVATPEEIDPVMLAVLDRCGVGVWK
ncbi:MAG: hypothetical protein ACRDFS_03165 [Chloroflexota bacterium]